MALYIYITHILQYLYRVSYSNTLCYTMLLPFFFKPIYTSLMRVQFPYQVVAVPSVIHIKSKNIEKTIFFTPIS